MITWKIYINNTLVEEPQGFSEIVLNITRDEQWHGIFFEASTSTLRFYGAGATLLRTEKQTNGLAASATFKAEAVCGETTDILEGSFDFGTYNDKCGNECMVEIAIEKKGCLMTLKNRYDQKVDLSKQTAFDNTTLLPNYTGLNMGIELIAQKIAIGNEAKMQTAAMTEVISNNPNWGDSDGFNNYRGYMAPPLSEVTNSSFGAFNASPIIDLCAPTVSATNRPPYPDFPTTSGTATLLGDITCALTDTNTSFRIKGSASVTLGGGAPAPSVGMAVVIFRLPAGLDGTIAANWINLYDVSIFSRNTTGSNTFDLEVLLMSAFVNQGDFIFFGIKTSGSSLGQISNFTVTFDPETYYKLQASSASP